MIWIWVAAVFLFFAVTMLSIGLAEARDTLAAIERETCDCPFHERERF